MSKPMVGEQVALQNGMKGAVFGVRETVDGISVQFSADGEWCAFAPAEASEPDAAVDAEDAEKEAPADPVVARRDGE